jgi:Ankyrin repeats (3 copies)
VYPHHAGKSALMAAAANGHVTALQVILENGAPWNALDRRNRSAGDYAFENKHQAAVDLLLQAGVRAELLLSLIRKRKRARAIASSGKEAPAKNADYLECMHLLSRARVWLCGAVRICWNELRVVRVKFMWDIVSACIRRSLSRSLSFFNSRFATLSLVFSVLDSL